MSKTTITTQDVRDSAINFAKMQDVATATIVGRSAGGNGVLSALTTLPTSIQTNITQLGVITVGTWNASTIGPVYGGTGLSAYSTGDTLYASAANTLSKLAIGTNGHFMKVAAGIPSWSALTSGEVTTALTYTPVNLNGDTMTGLLILSGDPVTALGAASRQYVDALAFGLDWKASVRVATTANITLSGAQTIDGVSVIAGDRVLVKNQSTGANNGLYLCAAGAWTRTTDADVSAEVTSGMTVFVSEGTIGGGTSWTLTTADPIVLATTALVFAQISGVGTYTASGGITLTGSNFAITTNGITNAMIRQSAGLSVIGNSTNATANVADITGTDGQVLRVSGTALGFGTIVAAGIASDAVTTIKILNSNVTLAKLADIATMTVLGNSTGGAAAPVALTTLPTGVQDNITRLGTVVSGTLSTGAVIAGVTMTLGSDGTGDTYYRSAGGVLTRLAAGTPGYVLTMGATLPSWAATAATSTFVYKEVPSGTINSINATFTVANAPSPALSLTLWKNGLLQRAAGEDFTLTGTSIVFVAGNIPQTNDSIVCDYKY